MYNSIKLNKTINSLCTPFWLLFLEVFLSSKSLEGIGQFCTFSTDVNSLVNTYSFGIQFCAPRIHIVTP